MSTDPEKNEKPKEEEQQQDGDAAAAKPKKTRRRKRKKNKNKSEASKNGGNEETASGNNDENGGDQPNGTKDGQDGEKKMEKQEDDQKQAMSHPLRFKWSFWFHKSAKTSWSNKIKKACDFETIEGFWNLFNNIAPPTHLSHGCNYHLFKTGIHPSWEDEHNTKGGDWRIVLTSKELQRIDEIWMHTVMGMIGEMFDDAMEICGVVLSLRKAKTRIELWTRDASKEIACKRIAEQWRQMLGLEGAKMDYQSHTAALTGTNAPPKSNWSSTVYTL